MINRDYNYLIEELTKRVEQVETKVNQLKHTVKCESEDIDNKTLMRKWNRSERTLANYRRQGLNYHKIGGRIYYQQKDLDAFKKQKTKNY